MLMTKREIEKALTVNRDTYPGQTVCAVCGEIWYAHNGEICPVCCVCGKHGLQHRASPGQPIDVIEVRESAEYVWVLCQGGTTKFLPQLDCDA